MTTNEATSVRPGLRAIAINRGRSIHERFLYDPVGLLALVLGGFIMGYGDVGQLVTPFRIAAFEAWAGAVFSGVEVIMLTLLGLGILRRTVTKDFYVTPSRLTMPMLWLTLITILMPYLRMVVTEGGFRIPFEANFMPFFVIMFVAWRLLFHPSDIRLMCWIIIVATAYKSIEGIAIWFSNDVVWGVLTGWRDGMLLSMAFSAAIICFIIKPSSNEIWYARIRTAFFVLAPFAIFVFVTSMRRSYMLGLLMTIPILYFYLKKPEKKRLFTITLLLAPIFLASVFVFGIDSFTSRLTGIIEPSQESSAAWRLIEYYNTVQMIYQKPIFGWPWGVNFINFTAIDLPSINTLMPHNAYLYMLLRAGVIGLGVWIWVLVVMVRMNLNAIRHAPTPGYRFLALWMLSGSLLVILGALTNPIFASKLTILIPFCMAMSSFLPGAYSKGKGKGEKGKVGEVVIGKKG